MRTTGHGRWVVVLVAVFVLILLPEFRPVLAGSIRDAGFALRFTAGISRVSRYADVSGMSGASVGSKWASSWNPAGSGWSPATGPSGIGASGQYSCIAFDEGTVVHLGSLSGAFGPEDSGTIESSPTMSGFDLFPPDDALEDAIGVFQPGLLVLESNHATMSDGVGFEWSALYGELQWGKKVSESFGIGANVSFLVSETRYDVESAKVARSEGETYAMRIGGLYEASDTLYFGLALEYSINPSRTTNFDFMGLGIGDQKERDTLKQFVVRPGVSFMATKDLTLNLDYQYGHFRDGTGSLDVHRFYVGGDQTVIEGLYLRGGVVIDTEGNISPALGLGIAPSETVYIDIAWQKNLFPEIELEFGKSDMISVGLTILF